MHALQPHLLQALPAQEGAPPNVCTRLLWWPEMAELHEPLADMCCHINTKLGKLGVVTPRCRTSACLQPASCPGSTSAGACTPGEIIYCWPPQFAHLPDVEENSHGRAMRVRHVQKPCPVCKADCAATLKGASVCSCSLL